MPDAPRLYETVMGGPSSGARTLSDRDQRFDPRDLGTATGFGTRLSELAGRSVLVATNGQIASALAMIELDGVARRMVVAPSDLKPDDRAAIIADAAIDTIVGDVAVDAGTSGLLRVPCGLPFASASARPAPTFDTEWVLLTSGTTGRPKMVVHSLSGLTGAMRGAAALDTPPVWATFYDIRRYGGLQIFLRGIVSGGSLVLGSDDEPLADHLHRLGAAGVTHISGTPSHWRRVLMSQAIGAMAPAYIRLSGEIADQAVLDGLRAAYPEATIGHAYASTEAGVGFDVNDGLEGFPVALTERVDAPVRMKVLDGSLRIASSRIASGYVGANAATLADADGFVDTGDMLERRGDRYYFVGRRGGIINVGGLKVHPEEVEASINSHPGVRMSLVTARKNPFTGAIVVADVVLSEPPAPDAVGAVKEAILTTCRESLDRHKVPVSIRIVPHLDLMPTGKLRRTHG